MKNKLIILLLLFTTWQANAQNKQAKDPYIPILTDSMHWWSAFVSEFGVGCYEKSIEETLLYDDTLYYRQGGAWFVEDTTERRVYRLNAPVGIGERRLMYDFSLKEGDSIWLDNYVSAYYWFYVDSIREIDTHSGKRKAWYLHFDHGTIERPVWVEGIGSLAGFRVYNTTPGISYWGQGLLTCFYQGDSLFYEHDLAQQYDCALTGYLGTETLESDNDFILFPNPADEIVTIKNYKCEVCRLDIYNLYGNKIYNSFITTDDFSVNVKSFKSGIYFYIISNNEQIIYNNKFIVKH